MALERTHRTDNTEHFGPVRLGAQDLRDVAAVFETLVSKAPPMLPSSRTKFVLPEHETGELADVLAFADADTLPSIHVVDGEVRLGLHAGHDGTLITRHHAARDAAEQQAVDEAADKLRELIRARQMGRVEALRQRGAGKGLLIALLTAPTLLLVVGPVVLDLWLTRAASQAVTSGLVVLSVVPTFVLAGRRPKDLIRLRGQPKPWWERRQGLIALVGVVLAVVIPFVIFALETRRG